MADTIEAIRARLLAAGVSPAVLETVANWSPAQMLEHAAMAIPHMSDAGLAKLLDGSENFLLAAPTATLRETHMRMCDMIRYEQKARVTHHEYCDSILSPSDIVAGITTKPCNCHLSGKSHDTGPIR